MNMKEGLSSARLYDLAQSEAAITKRNREQYPPLHWAYVLSRHAEYLTKTDGRTILSVAGMVTILTVLGFANNDVVSFIGSEVLAVFGGVLTGVSYRPISRSSEIASKLAGKFTKNVLKIDNTKKLFKDNIKVEDVEKLLQKYPDVVAPEEIRKWIKGDLGQAYGGDPRIEIVQAIYQRNLKQRRPLTPRKEASVRKRTVNIVMEAQALAQFERRSPIELNKEVIKERIDSIVTAIIFGGVGTVINLMFKAYVATGFLGLVDDVPVVAPAVVRIVNRDVRHMYPIMKDKVILSKQKFSAGWKKTQEKLRKTKSFLSKSQQ